MKHAREDYRFVVDLRSMGRDEVLALHEEAESAGPGIPDDEPVFLLRGKDACAPLAVFAWVGAARLLGADGPTVYVAQNQAEEMRGYQKRFSFVLRGKGKVPDLPSRGPGKRHGQ